MSRLWNLASAWRWLFVLALGLFLGAASPLATTTSWALEDEDGDIVDADGDGFEDSGDEEAEPEPKKKPRTKKKRLTKAERAAIKAQKAKEKANRGLAKARKKETDAIATRLGKKPKGFFVVSLETNSWTMGKSKKPVPKLEYEILVEEGRDAAANKILDFLLDIKRKTPKAKVRTSTKPPKGTYALIGRYDDITDAKDKKSATELECKKKIAEHNRMVRKKFGSSKRGGSGGLKGNPL